MGDFNFVVIASDPVGEEDCRFTFFKDNATIPEKYYTRIGKQKPAPKS
jgi:hypothetical protein